MDKVIPGEGSLCSAVKAMTLSLVDKKGFEHILLVEIQINWSLKEESVYHSKLFLAQCNR